MKHNLRSTQIVLIIAVLSLCSEVWAQVPTPTIAPTVPVVTPIHTYIHGNRVLGQARNTYFNPTPTPNWDPFPTNDPGAICHQSGSGVTAGVRFYVQADGSDTDGDGIPGTDGGGATDGHFALLRTLQDWNGGASISWMTLPSASLTDLVPGAFYEVSLYAIGVVHEAASVQDFETNKCQVLSGNSYAVAQLMVIVNEGTDYEFSRIIDLPQSAGNPTWFKPNADTGKIGFIAQSGTNTIRLYNLGVENDDQIPDYEYWVTDVMVDEVFVQFINAHFERGYAAGTDEEATVDDGKARDHYFSSYGSCDQGFIDFESWFQQRLGAGYAHDDLTMDGEVDSNDCRVYEGALRVLVSQPAKFRWGHDIPYGSQVDSIWRDADGYGGGATPTPRKRAGYIKYWQMYDPETTQTPTPKPLIRRAGQVVHVSTLRLDEPSASDELEVYAWLWADAATLGYGDSSSSVWMVLKVNSGGTEKLFERKIPITHFADLGAETSTPKLIKATFNSTVDGQDWSPAKDAVFDVFFMTDNPGVLIYVDEVTGRWIIGT